MRIGTSGRTASLNRLSPRVASRLVLAEEAQIRKQNFPDCDKALLDFYWNVHTRRHSQAREL